MALLVTLLLFLDVALASVHRHTAFTTARSDFTRRTVSPSVSVRLHFSPSQLRMATEEYDVVIIGCGVGGHGAALHAVGQGLKTAVLTGNDVGGTCVNRGCVPSKALLAAAGVSDPPCRPLPSPSEF